MAQGGMRSTCGKGYGRWNKTEVAYRRSDALEKRRKLMAAWAAFCASAPKEAQGNVTQLRR